MKRTAFYRECSISLKMDHSDLLSQWENGFIYYVKKFLLNVTRNFPFDCQYNCRLPHVTLQLDDLHTVE